MTLTRNLTIQQGDTTDLIIPILDGDDPDADWVSGIDNTDIEVTIARPTSETAAVTETDLEISVEPFSAVTIGSDAFAAQLPPGIDTIPPDQDVVRVRLPASVTGELAASGLRPYAFQVRLNSADERLTPVRGELTVEPAVGGGV